MGTFAEVCYSAFTWEVDGMGKARCAVCSTGKGRRLCDLNGHSRICAPCCARMRGPQCEGCIYWEQARSYSRSREQRPSLELIMIPRDVSDQVDGAMELASRAQLDEAEGIVLPLLEEYGDLDVVQHAVGVIRALQGRTDEALEHFGCAIAICPDFTEAWFNKACAHRERLEIGPMIRCFQTVVEIGDPDESHVREAAEEIRRLEEVIRDSDGLSLDRYLHLMDVFNGASTEMARGKWERAIRGFRRCSPRTRATSSRTATLASAAPFSVDARKRSHLSTRPSPSSPATSLHRPIAPPF